MKQDTDIQAKQQGEIILYQPDETVDRFREIFDYVIDRNM